MNIFEPNYVDLMSPKDYKSEFCFFNNETTPPPIQFLGHLENRRCRFCKRSSNQTAFSQKAHVFPAALGNSSLFTYEECDQCNNSGSFLEKELVNLFSVVRALEGGRGRKKDRTSHETDYGSIIRVDKKRQNRKITVVSGDPDLSISQNDSFAKIRAKVGVVNFQIIGRALARIAWHVLDRAELHKFEHLRLWINGQICPRDPYYVNLLPILHITPAPPTALHLFKRKTANKSFAPFIMGFAYKALFFVFPTLDSEFNPVKQIIPNINFTNKSMGYLLNCSRDTEGELFSTIILGDGAVHSDFSPKNIQQ